jgi:signal peptidase II
MKRGNELLKLGLSLIVAGGASNVWDRIKRKYVVDYIYWKRLKKIIFNLADVMIALGSVLVLLHSFVSEK